MLVLENSSTQSAQRILECHLPLVSSILGERVVQAIGKEGMSFGSHRSPDVWDGQDPIRVRVESLNKGPREKAPLGWVEYTKHSQSTNKREKFQGVKCYAKTENRVTEKQGRG